MYNFYYILYSGLTVQISSPVNVNTNISQLDNFIAHVPAIARLTQTIDKPDITINHTFSDKLSFEQNDMNFNFSTYPCTNLPQDIFHLLYAIERKQLIDQNLYPVHAACVGLDKNYILLVGHSGCGKTTVVQKLIDQKIKLFSGNKTVIGFDLSSNEKTVTNTSLLAVAGTKIITALDENSKRYSYYLGDNQCCFKDKVNISTIFLVKLDSCFKRYEKIEYPENLHVLYPYFMDHVNSDTIINGQFILDGSTGTVKKTYLIENLKNTLKNIQVFKITGSADFISKEVYETFV